MNSRDPVAISAIEHYEYCPRQCALIHVDGVWSENEHTVRGARGHRRADESDHRVERGRTIVRAVPVWSEHYELNGRADAIEVAGDGEVVPLEYKMGVAHGHAAHLQLCAVALCLEEMLDRPISAGYLWFSATRRRTQVTFDDALRSLTLDVVDQIRNLRDADRLLPPAPNDERCTQCQLISHCMPDLVQQPVLIEDYLRLEVLKCDS